MSSTDHELKVSKPHVSSLRAYSENLDLTRYALGLQLF